MSHIDITPEVWRSRGASRGNLPRDPRQPTARDAVLELGRPALPGCRKYGAFSPLRALAWAIGHFLGGAGPCSSPHARHSAGMRSHGAGAADRWPGTRNSHGPRAVERPAPRAGCCNALGLPAAGHAAAGRCPMSEHALCALLRELRETRQELAMVRHAPAAHENFRKPVYHVDAALGHLTAAIQSLQSNQVPPVARPGRIETQSITSSS